MNTDPETASPDWGDHGALVAIVERIMTQHWDLTACCCWVCVEGRAADCRPREAWAGWRWPDQHRERVVVLPTPLPITAGERLDLLRRNFENRPQESHGPETVSQVRGRR